MGRCNPSGPPTPPPTLPSIFSSGLLFSWSFLFFVCVCLKELRKGLSFIYVCFISWKSWTVFLHAPTHACCKEYICSSVSRTRARARLCVCVVCVCVCQLLFATVITIIASTPFLQTFHAPGRQILSLFQRTQHLQDNERLGKTLSVMRCFPETACPFWLVFNCSVTTLLAFNVF